MVRRSPVHRQAFPVGVCLEDIFAIETIYMLGHVLVHGGVDDVLI